MLGLGVEQADRLDRLAQLFFAELQHRLRCLHFPEQVAGGKVHARIGCLRGEDDRDQQGVGIHIVKLGFRFGDAVRQPAEQLPDFSRLHGRPNTSLI